MAGTGTARACALGELGDHHLRGQLLAVTQTIPLAIHGSLERDFDAAVVLSLLVLGLSFAVILVARFFTRRAEAHAGHD